MELFHGFGLIFILMFIGFIIFSVLFLVVFISILRKNASRERQNNESPRLTTDATVVTKRSHVWGDHSHTDYYATFQFPSGDRMELEVPHSQFGYLVEGDKGQLTFQGTRFLNFERTL